MRLALTPLSIDFDSKTGPIDPSEWIKSQISCRYWSWEKVMVNGVVVTNPEENLWDKTNKAWCFKCSVRSYGNASWVNKSIDVPKSNLNHKHHVYYLMHLSFNVMPAGRGRGGGGRACGGDLIVFVTPGDRAFDWSCSPRGGDIWIFLRPTWRYLTADSDEKDWHRAYVSRFHASRMHRTVWKDQEVMEANENKQRLSGFHCFIFKFCLF